MISTNRALIDLPIVILFLVVWSQSFDTALGKRPLATAFLQIASIASRRQRRATGAVVVHVAHKTVGHVALWLLRLLLCLTTPGTHVGLNA